MGDASWITHIQELRKKTVQQFATKLKLLAQVAHLDDAEAILKGDPDPSLTGAVRAFWLENKPSLTDDPAEWAAYVDRRANELHSLTQVLSEHPELTVEGK